MPTPRQQVWDTATRRYHDGPNLASDNKTFTKYCVADSVLKVKRSRVYPTTTSNDLYRDMRLWTTRQLVPKDNNYVAFRNGHISSQLWLTTYPLMAPNSKLLSDDAILFHVHVSAEPITEPVALGRFPSLLPDPNEDSPEVSLWCTAMTRPQFAPQVLNGFDEQSSVVLNQGPILRPGLDILYLDKTFWRQYFNSYSPNADVLIPGVYPSDLSRVQQVAVDIAVLRNKDEFTAVAQAMRRHLPNVTSFSAVVTKIIPRAVDGPKEQIALLENGLPDVFVSLEEKVRIGVHESNSFVPAQGIVSANLSRLNLLATPTGVLKTQYMLLAYFEDAVQSLHGGSADVDLPKVYQRSGPASVSGDYPGAIGPR